MHDDGYQYKKKKSRSKSFGTEASTHEVLEKKPRLSQETRSKRLSDIEEDVKGMDTQIQLLERAREKYTSTQQYEHAAEKCKEIASIRDKKRKLQSEVTQLQKLDVKSKKYH